MVTITVNSPFDTNGGAPNLDDLSLREAITIASSGDTIVFGAGLSGGILELSQGEIDLTIDLTIDGDIDGDNKADITISGGIGSNNRIFHISGAATDVNLLSLALRNGYASGSSKGESRVCILRTKSVWLRVLVLARRVRI